MTVRKPTTIQIDKDTREKLKKKKKFGESFDEMFKRRFRL
jgi:predicted CopG family antitoxin